MNNKLTYEELEQKVKALEEKLNDTVKNELRLKLITENITEVFWMADVDINKMIYISPGYEHIWGRSCQSLYDNPRSFIDAIHPDDRERIVISLLAQRDNQSINHEYRIIKPDGSVRVIWDRGFPVSDKVENNNYYVGIAQDITVNKRISEELKILNQQLKIKEIAIESAIDAISIADLSWNLVYANQSMNKLFGYNQGELIGKAITVINPDTKKRSEIQQSILEKDGWSGEALLQHKNGEKFPAFLSLSIIRDDNGKNIGSLGAIRDITELKQSEKKQNTLQEQLLQTQKMNAVGRLAGGVAHDFNNMLMVILGYTEISIDSLDSSEPLYENLKEIRNAAKRSANLTRQLLAFARKQSIAPIVIDINPIVGGMLKLLERLIGENIHLHWQQGTDLWHIKVDPSQLDQILANLCVNARDAIAGVGNVSIETGNATCDKVYCSNHVYAVPGDYVMLTVSDDGCGMEKEILANIFEPFFTTKEFGKGTGLGLATVYGIVKQNNGFINVYSEPGKGTTFKIHLPRHIDDSLQTGKEDVVESAGHGHETILLVEDEPVILKIGKVILEGLGYKVLTADLPIKAINIAKEYAGGIDLLITDVIMPEMHGRDLAQNILSILPHIKCMFMSGYTADVIARDGLIDEGTHFIQKPFSRNQLAAKVREALA